jgi:DNA-binding cell septation regulator SpoVG
MPSTSKKQRKFMAAAANNSKFAKRAKISQSVAKKYNRADRSAMTAALSSGKKGGYAG